MAGIQFTTASVTSGDKLLNGGLNSTAGPLGLNNNESSKLLNIDFDKFGSILKRNGYSNLNTTATSGSNLQCDGLYWYEFDNVGTATRYLIKVSGGNIYTCTNLTGNWGVPLLTTSTLAFTATNHCDFETFLNTMIGTNGVNVPFCYPGSGSAYALTVPTGLTAAKYVRLYNNYLFLGNVTVSSVVYPSRVYFSDIKSITSWQTYNYIDISKDDGQAITGMRVLGDRLVIYKEKSIYNLYFTGDSDIPFTLPGGGKSNSNVGCIAPFSIAEVENYHVFLAADGFYFYDGMNSTKISDKIRSTLLEYNTGLFTKARATNYRLKNRYMCALPTGTQNDRIVIWDYYNNAWSIYSGMYVSDITNVMSAGTDERIYFSDYSGYDYRLDNGTDDYPLLTATAISCHYYTNWRTFDDLVNQKGVPIVVIYYQINTGDLTFSYSYDFEDADQYSVNFSMDNGISVYDDAVFDDDTYCGSGGYFMRKDLMGRGRVVRFGFTNNALGITFRIDGFGTLPHLETMV
jgi:hypothetical protein